MVADNERTKIPTLVIKFPKVYRSIYVGVGVAGLLLSTKCESGPGFVRIYYLNDRIPPIHVPRPKRGWDWMGRNGQTRCP